MSTFGPHVMEFSPQIPAFYNNNYYLAVDGNLTWDEAFAAAAAMTYQGRQGHLVTVSAAAEYEFLRDNLFNGSTYYWAGATDVAQEGVWKWVAGPEAGTQFWQSNSTEPNNNGFGSIVGGAYSNWVFSEPNNGSNGQENHLILNYLGVWGDDVGSYQRSHIVEFSLPASTDNADSLTGTPNADTLEGIGGSDSLVGLAGDDLLNGGAGADTLTGGAGNDTYVVDDAGDRVIEAAGGGTDLVQSSITYTLAAEVENLTLTGTAAINGTGNALANAITGNSANNVLNGGAGADTLTGGAGNDTYVVDDAGDRVIEAAGGGTDLVQSSITYTLAAEVENLTLTGTAAINGTGNALANAITGNSANNVLDGLAGADTLTGGAGNDTYVVDDSGDRVIEAAGGGTDLVQSSITYTLAAEVENLTLTGTAAINGTGNALANAITGNSANNVLDGGAGDDTLVGGGGRDLLSGGTGADLFRYVATSDSGTTLRKCDQILDFSGTEGDRIDLSALDAHSALNGDQAFSFIGTAEFSALDAAGQLRYEYDEDLNLGILYASLDADEDAEFAIILRGVAVMNASDIIL